MDNKKSMIDVAYELMVKKKKAIDFQRIWKEVSEVKGYTENEMMDKQSLFYTSITLDGRFITVGENQWDLRSRHKFEDVHIDMNDIYADTEEEEEESESDEDDDGLIEDDYSE